MRAILWGILRLIFGWEGDEHDDNDLTIGIYIYCMWAITIHLRRGRVKMFDRGE